MTIRSRMNGKIAAFFKTDRYSVDMAGAKV